MARHTLAEWAQLADDSRVELVDGEYVQKAVSGFGHGAGQGIVFSLLHGEFGRPPGSGGRTGGWWFSSDVDVRIGEDGFRPDLAGWRRERVPVMARTGVVEHVPEWICEIVSESNRSHDTVLKMRKYHRGGVGHYWLLDPGKGTLSVYRHHPEGYLDVLLADRGERVRAEPFDVLELRVGELLGDDPP